MAAYLLFYTFQYLPLPLFPLAFVNDLNLTDGQISLGNGLFYGMMFLVSLRLSRIRAVWPSPPVGRSAILFAYPLLLGLAQMPRCTGRRLLGGAVWALLSASLINRLMETPADDRPACMALHNLVLNLGILIGSLSAWLSGHWIAVCDPDADRPAWSPGVLIFWRSLAPAGRLCLVLALSPAALALSATDPIQPGSVFQPGVVDRSAPAEDRFRACSGFQPMPPEMALRRVLRFWPKPAFARRNMPGSRAASISAWDIDPRAPRPIDLGRRVKGAGRDAGRDAWFSVNLHAQRQQAHLAGGGANPSGDLTLHSQHQPSWRQFASNRWRIRAEVM